MLPNLSQRIIQLPKYTTSHALEAVRDRREHYIVDVEIYVRRSYYLVDLLGRFENAGGGTHHLRVGIDR